MIPTPIGAFVLILGLWLLFRPATEMLVFVLFCSLFAGASAIDAVALGHSSIPPNMVALGFLILRLFRRDLRATPAMSAALRQNAWLLIFCVYGAISAFILPRIFAERVVVMSMQHAKVLAPLVPSSQNLTQALYLLGTGLAAVSAGVVLTRPEAPLTLVRAIIWISWIHILTGIVDAGAALFHISGVFDFLRNGSYAQLDQEVYDYHRIAGMTPEPSAYAGLGVFFLVFNTELWLRNVMSLRTGLTAISIAIMLLAATSTTGYILLGSYAVVLIIRFALSPSALGWGKGSVLALVLALSSLLCLVLLLNSPAAIERVAEIMSTMTFGKAQSSSGVERAAWGRQGWDLFIETRGLGVGVGSFRSSNIFTAVLGSVGPASLFVLAVYYLQVFKLGRVSTYRRRGIDAIDIGAAAAWVPVLYLVPASFSAPSPDPGILCAIFCGTALVLRARQQGETISLNSPADLAHALTSAKGAHPRLDGAR